MPRQPCPSVGCTTWTSAPGKWLDPPDGFSLQIDEAKWARNQRVCNSCLNCHRYPWRSLNGRLRKPTSLDQLLAAAAVSPALPPSKTSPVKQLTPRRSWTIKEKESICREWSEAQSHAQKQVIREKYRAEQLDGHQVQQWKEALARNSSSPKGKKAAKHEVRLRVPGHPTQLSEAQEMELDEWVMSLRRKRLAVLVYEIQQQAKRMFPTCQDGVTVFRAGSKWVSGFMARRKLTVRLATTNKAVTTPEMRTLKFHFRNKLVSEYHLVNPLLIFNMDETSVTLDAPGLRTVDRVGAKCVEIATTGHDFKRVAVVICVSRGGALVTPLVIRSGGVKSPYFHKLHWESHGDMQMWVTENKKAWLDSLSMARWIETVYVPFIRTVLAADHRHVLRQDISHTHLFMDNCSVHDSEVSMSAMLRHNVKATFFPPNCTPILQPCDQNINHIFKLEYERRWRDWMTAFGHTADNVTRFGNPAAAAKSEYMSWIGQALQAIDKKVIEDSWRMSCTGYKLSVFHLSPELWQLVLSYLNNGPERRRTERDSQGNDIVVVSSSDIEQLACITRDRKLFTAWRTYNFPVKRKRKAAATAAEQPIVTTSTPTKRRKGRAATDDDDLDVDSDKENRPPEQPMSAAEAHKRLDAQLAAWQQMGDEAQRRMGTAADRQLTVVDCS